MTIVVLPARVTEPGLALINQWKAKKYYLNFGFKETDLVLMLGGSAAWKLVKGLPLDDEDDIDFYFQGCETMRIPVDCMRDNIGPIVSKILGLTDEEIANHKDKLRNDLHPSQSYYLIKRKGYDFNIGSREIYSNFQVSIDVETGHLIFDSRIPNHKRDFERFIHLNEIITYRLPELVANFHLETDQTEAFKPLSVLCFVFKSYLKPLSSGAHFDLKTAKDILAFKNKTANARLIAAMRKRMHSFYGVSADSLDNIFACAQRDAHLPLIHKELKKEILLRQTQEELQVSHVNALDNQISENKRLAAKNQQYADKLKATKDELNHVMLENSTLKHRNEAAMKSQATLKSDQAKFLLEKNQQVEAAEHTVKAAAETIDLLSSDNITLKTSLDKVTQSEAMYKEELELQCHLYFAAIYLKNRLIDPETFSIFNAHALLTSKSEYLSITNSSDPILNMQLEVASATLVNTKGQICFFTSFFNRVLNYKFQLDPNAQQLRDFFLDLDTHHDSDSEFALSAEERFKELTLFIRYAIAFVRTEFAQKANPNRHPSFQMLLALGTQLTANEFLPLLQKLDAIKLFLEKNSKLIAQYFEDTQRPISSRLENVLTTLFAMEADLPKNNSSLSGYACERFLLHHRFSVDQFQLLFEKYKEAQQTRNRTQIVDVWNRLYQTLLVPSRKASAKEKLVFLSPEINHKFLKTFFQEIALKFPEYKANYLIKAHLISLKYQHTEWTTLAQWTEHPLVKSLSVIFSSEARINIIRPIYWGPLVVRALNEIKNNCFIPDRLLNADNEQAARDFLREMIEAFLLVIPGNDQTLIQGYKILALYLKQPVSVINPLIFSNFPVNDSSSPAQYFIQSFFKEKKNIEGCELNNLDKHLAGLTQPCIESVAKLMNTVIISNAANNPAYGLELCALLTLESHYMTNFGKFFRFFKEKESLEKVGILDCTQINAMMMTSLRLLPIYKSLRECETQLQTLFDHPESSTQELETVKQILSKIPGTLNTAQIAKIVSAILPTAITNDQAAKLFKLAGRLAEGNEHFSLVPPAPFK